MPSGLSSRVPMPKLNAGTLLENLVLVEAADLLLGVAETAAEDLLFANAFAMPPVSTWSGTGAGFSDDDLDRVSETRDVNVGRYAELLRTVLRLDPSRGPNGAVLVGQTAARRGRRVRMWLNDIEGSTHYANVPAELERLEEVLTAVGAPDALAEKAKVCGKLPFPLSMISLKEWLTERRVGVAPMLGYLDPDAYTLTRRADACTNAESHRAWLRALRSAAPSFAVHFMANQTAALRRKLISGMEDDAAAAGWAHRVTFEYGNYCVFVASSRAELAAALEATTQDAWTKWRGIVAKRLKERLTVYRSP